MIGHKALLSLSPSFDMGEGKGRCTVVLSHAERELVWLAMSVGYNPEWGRGNGGWMRIQADG